MIPHTLDLLPLQGEVLVQICDFHKRLFRQKTDCRQSFGLSVPFIDSRNFLRSTVRPSSKSAPERRHSQAAHDGFGRFGVRLAGGFSPGGCNCVLGGSVILHGQITATGQVLGGPPALCAMRVHPSRSITLATASISPQGPVASLHDHSDHQDQVQRGLATPVRRVLRCVPAQPGRTPSVNFRNRFAASAAGDPQMTPSASFPSQPPKRVTVQQGGKTTRLLHRFHLKARSRLRSVP